MYLVHSTIAPDTEYFKLYFLPSGMMVQLSADNGFMEFRDSRLQEIVLVDLDTKSKLAVSYNKLWDLCLARKLNGVFIQSSSASYGTYIEGIVIPYSLYCISEYIDYVGQESIKKGARVSMFEHKDVLIIRDIEHDGTFVHTFSMGDRYVNFHTPAFICRVLFELLAFNKEDFDTFVTIEGNDLYLKGYKHVASSSNLLFKLDKIYHFKVHDWTKIKAILAAHSLARG